MEDQFNLIDRYLLGKLNSEELKNFEQQMKMDQSLAKQVEQQRKAVQFLEIVRDNEMKDKLKTIHQEVRDGKEAKTRTLSGRRKILMAVFGAAASVLLLIFCYNMLSKSTSPEQLYADYFQTYNGLAVARDQSQDSVLVQAVQLYQQKNYAAALSSFQGLAPLTENTMISLAIGVCQMELNNPQSAMLQFQQLLDDPLYQEPAQWYLALTY